MNYLKILLLIIVYGLTISIAQDMLNLKIDNFYFYYPSYYIKVNLYNVYQTVVLIDSRNQNRSIYLEVIKAGNIDNVIKQIETELEDLYEKNYKVFIKEKKDFGEHGVYIIGYTFPAFETEYKNLKYYIEVEKSKYIGVYCMAPSKDFEDIYLDFIKIVNSLGVK